jgi:hypothetical protein
VRHAESGDEPANLITSDENIDAKFMGDGRHSLLVSESGNRCAPGSKCALDN